MVVIDFIIWAAGFFAGTDFTLDVPAEFWDTLNNIFAFIGYFIPLGTVKAIFLISLALMSVRIMISTFKTLWAIIPIL